jgi:hypothetical protein
MGWYVDALLLAVVAVELALIYVRLGQKKT